MADADDEMPDEPRPRFGAGARLRTYFLTGLVIAGPLAITLYLTWSFVGWVDAWVKPFLPLRYNPDTYFDFPIPGVGLLVAITGLTVLGFLTANIVGRSLVSVGEYLLGRMPVVRNLYSALKQMFQTAVSGSGRNFSRAALMEWPRKGVWSLVLVAGPARGEIAARLTDLGPMVSVILLATPNPTSGYLMFVPESDLVYLDMRVEEALKLVISIGLVVPDFPAHPPAVVGEPPAGVTTRAPASAPGQAG